MTPTHLTTWTTPRESDTLEFKRTPNERREATRALCAKLNHRRERVLVSVVTVGSIVGQQVSDHTIEQVAREPREIDPPVFPTTDRVPLANGCEVLVVGVSTGQNRPYSYRGQAFRRVGNTSQALSRDEYNRMQLERVHGEHRWENQPAAGWTVANLDAAEVTKSMDEAIRRGRVEDPGTRDLEAQSDVEAYSALSARNRAGVGALLAAPSLGMRSRSFTDRRAQQAAPLPDHADALRRAGIMSGALRVSDARNPMQVTQ